MGTMVINGTIFHDLDEQELNNARDAIKSTIDFGGDFVLIGGSKAGWKRVWISSASTIQLNYTEEPSSPHNETWIKA